MRRIPHGLYASLFGVVHLILTTNVLLVVGCLPLVAILITTDPVGSWPLIAVALPLCAPAVRGAFAVFAEQRRGGSAILRTFWRAWRSGWGRTTAAAAVATAVVAVALADLRFLAPTQIGVAVIPLLAVVVLLVAGTLPVVLVALVDAPGTRLAAACRTAAYLAVRRWHLTLASLVVLVVQAGLFTLSPALALGVSAAPALYLVWSNARYTLLPALPADHPVAA